VLVLQSFFLLFFSCLFNLCRSASSVSSPGASSSVAFSALVPFGSGTSPEALGVVLQLLHLFLFLLVLVFLMQRCCFHLIEFDFLMLIAHCDSISF
jgi:hypothetical protein